MNFGTFYSELAAQAGLDKTVSAQATLLKRWSNIAQSVVLSAFDWPFLKTTNPVIVQTVPDYSTGTITTTAGSTTATLTSAPTTSKTGFYLQTSSSDDWYKIASHTASSTTLTLDTAALSDLAGGTFIIRKRYYSAGTTLDRILEIQQTAIPNTISEVGINYFNGGYFDEDSVGTPEVFILSGSDSTTRALQFRLYPTPDTAANLEIYGYPASTDLVNDSDESIIPARWHNVWLEFAKMQAFSWMDDTRLELSTKTAYALLDRMKTEFDSSLNRHYVVRAIDEHPSTIGLRWPSNYPKVW